MSNFLRPEKINKSDIVQTGRMGDYYMIMDTLYDLQNNIVGFHGLPIKRADRNAETNDIGYYLSSARLMGEMGLPIRDLGYVIEYKFERIGPQVIPRGQLHDTPRERLIEIGYARAITDAEIGEDGMRDGPSRRRDRFHDYLPPQEEKPVRPYQRKTEEEKAEILRNKPTPKNVTRDLPLREAFQKKTLQYVGTPWILSGQILAESDDISKIITSFPLVNKDKSPLLDDNKKPIVIEGLKDAYNFVVREDWVSFASNNLFGVGKKTAENIRTDVIQAFHTLNQHKFK